MKPSRLKPSRGKPPYKVWARHLARVGQMPCLLSGRPATVHHVTGYADRMGRIPRSHKLIVPLAPEYHLIQFGPKTSVEALGHRGFYRVHGVNLFAEAERLWSESELIEAERKAA